MIFSLQLFESDTSVVKVASRYECLMFVQFKKNKHSIIFQQNCGVKTRINISSHINVLRIHPHALEISRGVRMHNIS